MEDLLDLEKSPIKFSECKHMLNKFYQTRCLQFLYLLLIILTIFCMVWVIIHRQYNRNTNLDDVWFVILEIAICAIVTLDLLVRIYLIGMRRFFHSWQNVLDAVLTSFCLIEVIIAITDIFLHTLNSIIIMAVLILRNVFMIIRIILIIKRSSQSKKSEPVVILTNTFVVNREPPTLESILENNIENLKHVYRARLDTLGEEDEVLESSLANNGSVWKGRISQPPRLSQ